MVLEELFLPAKIRFRFEIAVSAQIGNMLEIVLQERIRRPASLLQIRMAFYLNWHVLFHVITVIFGYLVITLLLITVFIASVDGHYAVFCSSYELSFQK